MTAPPPDVEVTDDEATINDQWGYEMFLQMIHLADTTEMTANMQNHWYHESNSNLAKPGPIFKLFFSPDSPEPRLSSHTVAGGPGREADWSFPQ